MDPINNLEILELSNALNSKEEARDILSNFLPLVSRASVHSERLYSRGQDPVAKSLLPSDLNDLVPIQSTGNGNCLFNSVSIALSGSESLSSILRLLTVSELFAYSEFYANHPQIAEIAATSNYSMSAIFNIYLSDKKAEDTYRGRSDNAARSIEVLATETAKPFVFSSQFHVLALASVIGKPVLSV